MCINLLSSALLILVLIATDGSLCIVGAVIVSLACLYVFVIFLQEIVVSTALSQEVLKISNDYQVRIFNNNQTHLFLLLYISPCQQCSVDYFMPLVVH